MGPGQDKAPIVVGVDGSAGARAALRFALVQGRARGFPVTVMTTWLQDGTLEQPPVEAPERAAGRIQDEAVAAVLADIVDLSAPGAPVPAEPDRLVVQDAAGAALVDASRRAAMLVVGSGRQGPVTRTFLGPVSEYCVRHASVPVVLVPELGAHRSVVSVPENAGSPSGQGRGSGTTQSRIVPLPW
jgi:nucleotide-binding universal stress UspA family protein